MTNENGETDARDANSCHLDWGTVEVKEGGPEVKETVQCVGIATIAGTGPFVYDRKEEADGQENRVIFKAHEQYWDGPPAIKQLEIVRYASSEEVKEDLINGDLDLVWGAGVLNNADIVEIANDPALQGQIDVFHSRAIQNVILLLNSGKAPFDNINVRKTVIHAINKAAIVQNELKGIDSVVDNVFPNEAPYCDVDLTPKWDYDFEKAVLLSCDGTAGYFGDDDDNKALALGLGLGLGGVLVLMGIAAVVLINKNKQLAAQLEKQGGVDA